MVKELIWTQLASEQYQQVVLYLKTFWSIKDADNFVNIVNQKLFSLIEFPHLGIASIKKPHIRQLHPGEHVKRGQVMCCPRRRSLPNTIKLIIP